MAGVGGPAPGPLAGFRVLDLSSVLSGPAATVLLADQGADVIKVEPLHGDIVRRMGRPREGITSGFIAINRGKRSLAVDLKRPEGVRLVEALARTADVFVQNFRPGAIERMGLGEPRIRELRPDIVYVSISGFGERGPYAHKRVYDPVIQALCGITDIQADDDGRPRMVRTVVPDKTTALTAAQAITAALLSRERTGVGQHVRLAMLDAMITYLWPEGLVGLTAVGHEDKIGVGQFAQDLIFKTTDGYITAGAVSDAEWRGMCAALERPEWLEDERFSTPAGRMLNVKERLAMTGQVLATRSSEEWLERLDRHGVPSAPVLMRRDLIHHEQIRENAIIEEFDHPGFGRVRQARPAARFSETPAGIAGPAPRLGEHGRQVLGELGYDNAAVDALVAQGVVAG